MTVSIKLVPFSTTSEADITSISAVTVTPNQRAARPYPPGNVKINGVAFPLTTVGDVELTWSHRYRLGPFVVAQDAGDVPGGPEGDYMVEVLIDGILISTATGITGTSFGYSFAQRLLDNPDWTLPTSLRLTPVNGLEGTPRTLTFLMFPIMGFGENFGTFGG